MTRKIANPERSFGVSVGSVLLVVAAVLGWRGRLLRAEGIAAVGALLLLCGYLRPSVLKAPSALWWRFSLALGQFNARVLLTLMFVLVFVPVSLVWRLTGKDPLSRKRERWPGWSAYPARYRDKRHYLKMF